MSEIYYSPAGRLLPKSQAPTCDHCGVAPWNPVGPPMPGDRVPWPTKDSKGRRLGYVKTHRKNFGGRPVCWNGRACKQRMDLAREAYLLERDRAR